MKCPKCGALCAPTDVGCRVCRTELTSNASSRRSMARAGSFLLMVVGVVLYEFLFPFESGANVLDHALLAAVAGVVGAAIGYPLAWVCGSLLRDD